MDEFLEKLPKQHYIGGQWVGEPTMDVLSLIHI